MTFTLEYHKSVDCSSRRSIPASLALFGTFLLPFLLVSGSPAQISAGSSNSGHAASAAPPTGAVAPFTGSVAPPTGVSYSSNFAHSTGISQNSGSWHNPGAFNNHNNNNNNDAHHHPHHTANGVAYYPYIYGVPGPYAVDTSETAAPDDDDNNNNDDAEYQGGPTIFDRRGSGQDSYIPPSYTGPAESASAQSDPAPEPPAPPTVLIFKDGHQLEVSNYAIVSPTLYDLTPGHPRKIALADLDLLATQKQNDDRGVTFQLPPTAQAN
ncbi:MAG: hypothetical protein WB919_20820 [Candidatus Sulfotelmatobacter sp.]